MKNITRLKKLTVLALLLALIITASAVTFVDSFCDREFKGESLWMSEINPNYFYGHLYDSENGLYRYDWVHQIWDSDLKQLYAQEKYDMTVTMEKILVNKGEWLDSVTYSLGVADYSTDTLITYYKDVDDIPVPECFGCMKVKVSGYDAVYIYSEDKTPGDGNGVMPNAYNDGRIYVPIVDAPNQDGRINTLVINCGIKGYNFDLYDATIGEYLALIQALPCEIKLDYKVMEFKKGAPIMGNSTSANDKNEKKGIPPIVLIGIGIVAVGVAVPVVATVSDSKKKATVSAPDPKPATTPKNVVSNTDSNPKPATFEPHKPEAKSAEPVKTEEELRKEKYIEGLKDKYGYEDEKELKKAIMRNQIHNEKMGYIYQSDEVWADAALDTAEKTKKVADVTIDVAAELSGPEGKVAKNIYTGLTEFGEATGEIMTGRDAAEALTEATVDASVGIVENEANGFRQKLAASALGESGKNFASTYMKTGGDLEKSLAEAGKSAEEGSINALIDGVTDGLVDKSVAKASAPVDEAFKKTLTDGVNASKTFTQDMIKNGLND